MDDKGKGSDANECGVGLMMNKGGWHWQRRTQGNGQLHVRLWKEHSALGIQFHGKNDQH